MRILAKNYQKNKKIEQRKNKSLKSSKDGGKSTSVGDIGGRTIGRPRL